MGQCWTLSLGSGAGWRDEWTARPGARARDSRAGGTHPATAQQRRRLTVSRGRVQGCPWDGAQGTRADGAKSWVGLLPGLRNLLAAEGGRVDPGGAGEVLQPGAWGLGQTPGFKRGK